MSAVKIGEQALPADPQTETLEWVYGTGETRSIEYQGERSDVLAKYETLKTQNGIKQATYSNANGRSRVIARFAREDIDGGTGDGVTIIEELFGIDELRAIHAAPAFRALSDDAIAAVLIAAESRLAEALITGYAGWAAAQKELRWQIIHGEESYYDTKFTLRIKKQGVRSSALRGVFTGINTVVAVPALSAGMAELVGTLPNGEWLYKPPQIEYAGRGVWSVSSEYHWAAKWSKVYGGTLGGGFL
jgi:hypothetical protein